ncbi:MAG: hypothetical protein NZM37_11920, partial [Sandaracinaceae bacterium]|nr:hypothetical protein [Sandaracinaceae bacterium]
GQKSLSAIAWGFGGTGLARGIGAAVAPCEERTRAGWKALVEVIAGFRSGSGEGRAFEEEGGEK